MTLSTSISVWIEPNKALDGMALIDHLFNRLDGAYPNRWRAAFPNDRAIQNWRETWSDAFNEEGITPSEIKSALSNCRKMYEWPPSLTEFIKACRPVIDPSVAYHEAVAGVQARERGELGKWSCPAVYWASVKIGAHDLKNMSFSAIKTRWEAAFRDALINGNSDPVPMPVKALPAPEPLSREEASKRMQELSATDAVKTPTDKTDHKAWARKILQRIADKDKTITAVQAHYAKQALEIKAANAV